LRVIRKLFQFFVDRPIKQGTVLLDRYEVGTVIGTGSYGIVYLCNDLKSNEKKVIKQLRPSKKRSKKEVELFQNEIYVLRSLKHKNIPAFVESFSTKGFHCYVMDFIDAKNIEAQIFSEKRTFHEKEALLILAHLLEVVTYIHEQDIYHQDLRIPNLFLKNREVFLIDFGLSKKPVVGMDPILSPFSHREVLKMKQQDYYDLGEILLYLLYTTYPSNNKKALPWTEELTLEEETVHLLKRLLRIKEPYVNVREISDDLIRALKANHH